MRIQLGMTGKLIKGHVLDSSPKYVERALKAYDPQLYVAWNSKKAYGHGVWEVRWKPEMKTVKKSKAPEILQTGKIAPAVQGDTFDWFNYTIVWPKYHENNFNNHVMDVPFMNYSVLERIKAMDMWSKDNVGYKGQHLTKELAYKEAKFLEKEEDNAWKDLEYNLKQHKSEIRWFKDFVLDGGNPYRIADHWK